MPTPKTMWFDGPCPLLLCVEEGGHTHPICPECAAVNYGNLFCTTCRTEGKEYRDQELVKYKATVAEGRD